MAIKKKINGTIYSPIGIHRKVNGVDYDIQAWYKGVSQNGSVVGIKVFEKSQPTPPTPTEIEIEYAEIVHATDYGVLLKAPSLTKACEMVIDIQFPSSSANFQLGGSSNGYIYNDSEYYRAYGTSPSTYNRAVDTERTTLDVNFHIADPEDAGGTDEYNWIFMHKDWDGTTMTQTSGFQVAYAKITGYYPSEKFMLSLPNYTKIYGLEWYTQEIGDKTTKTLYEKVTKIFYDVSDGLVKFRFANSIGSSAFTDDMIIPGLRKGAVEVTFNGQVNNGYIYDDKIWSDKLCYQTLYTPGQYTSSDGWLYTILSDGTYTKAQSITNLISGYTRTGNTTFNIKINGTNHSVTSNSSGYFELDCSSYYPITNLTQAVYNISTITSLKVDVDTSHCTNFTSAFSNILRTQAVAQDIDISSINMSASTNWQSMFYSSNYATIKLPPMTHNGVTTSKWMFYNCYRLTSVDISSAGNLSTLSDAQGMFQGCNTLTEINFSGVTNFSPSLTTNMFSGCSALSQIKVEGCDTTTINTLISELSAAGFTFIQSGNYLIKQ